MHTEFRYAELRSEGERQLSGVAFKYGDVAELPFGRERFEVRAFGDLGAADVILNTMHDRRRPLARSGSGLTLIDGSEALEVRATLPATREADDTLELVRTGVLRGLSIEFAATRERMVSGVRSVIAARLSGIAVVDRAAYPQSSVEAAVGFIARSLSTATVTPANNLTSGDGVVHFRVNSDFAWRVRAPARIGPEPNETQAELRTGTGRSIIAAFGLSPSMFESGSDGTAQRESFRRARPIEGVVESGDGLQGSSRLRDQRSGGSGNSRVLTINGLFRGKASGRWAIGRY